MKPSNFHEGDRSEYLALFAFSTIAYCAEVPRQHDRFGVDFFAHLARRQGANLVATGRAVAVQVKSAGTTMLINSNELRDSLYGQSLPFFLAEIDKATSVLRVFSLYNRLLQFWKNREANVSILLESCPDHPPADDGGPEKLYVGPPVFEASLADFENDETKAQRRAEFLAVVESWAQWEQLHLAWKEDQFPLISEMKNYATNTPLSLGQLTHELVDHLVATNPLYLEGAVASAKKTVYGIGEFLDRYLDDLEHFGEIAEHGEQFTGWAGEVRDRSVELYALLNQFKMEGPNGNAGAGGEGDEE